MMAVLGFARSLQGAIIIALSAALVALSLFVWGFNIGPIGFDGIADKLDDCRAERERLAEQSKRKIEQTARTVERIVYRDLPEADRRARVIETAPLPGNCETPRAVLEADL